MTIYILIILAVIAIWVIAVYNFFVSSRARIKASIQEIGNQLKRQSDLIPNLESSAKGYLSHEKSILTMLADARKMISSGKDASSKVAELLPKLQVVVESNPELKGNTVVANLMDELRDTADKIMYSRRLLIDLTADFNVKRVTFPSSLVAKLFNIGEEEGLKTSSKGEHMEVSDADTKTPKVKF